MPDIPQPEIYRLAERLRLDFNFFSQCLKNEVITMSQDEGYVDLVDGSIFRLRRLQRLCQDFEVGLPIAMLLMELQQRVADLESEIQLLKKTK